MNEKVNKKFKTHYYIGACLGIGISIFVKSIQIINIAGLIVILGFIVTLWILYSKDMTIQKQKTMAQFAEEYRIKEENLRNEFLKQFQQKIDLILPMLSSVKKQKEAIQIINSDVPIINTTPINIIPIKPETIKTNDKINNNIIYDGNNIENIIQSRLVNTIKAGIKTTYIYETIEELSIWKKRKHKIELSLNVNIVDIEIDPQNRRQVIITTVPADKVLPTYLEWEDRKFLSNEDFVITLGESLTETVNVNLVKDPHIAICGTSGSGKSNSISSLIYQFNKKKAHTIIIDLKGCVDYFFCEGYATMVTNKKDALRAFKMLVLEHEKRIERFKVNQVRNITEYNNKFPNDKLSRVVAVVDEAAELFATTGLNKDEKALVEEMLGSASTLARVARSTGISLCIGAQRADSSIFSGQLKCNLSTRVSGHMKSGRDSCVVLDVPDASKIPPSVKGRFVMACGNKVVEYQAPYFDEGKFKFTKTITKTLVDLKTFEINKNGIRENFRIAK